MILHIQKFTILYEYKKAYCEKWVPLAVGDVRVIKSL